MQGRISYRIKRAAERGAWTVGRISGNGFDFFFRKL